MTEFAGAVYELLRAALSNKSESAVAACLQILINLTFYSVNISLSLMSCQGFRSTLMALIGEVTTSSDAVWLLVHICVDNEIEFDSL